MKKNTVIKGAIILTLAALITRVIGFGNRIYLSNLIGAEGMGLYQLVFPVSMMCYTICCSGIFTAVSKLVAEEKAKKNTANLKRIVWVSSIISATLALILLVVLLLYADILSINLIHEPRTALSLKILAFSLPFAAITSCVKGYFYGLKKTSLPAVSQIFEQVIRITIIYLLSSTFIPMGLTYACAMAVIAICIADALTTVLVVLSYRSSIKKQLCFKRPSPHRTILRKISSIAVPLTSNRMITSLLIGIETILIPTKLQHYGMAHSNAISVYGILAGMALPLILFPTVFTNSLSLMLLPTISEAKAHKNHRLISFTTSKTIKFTLLIGIISTFLFLAFGESLGMIIYHEPYVGTLLKIMAWLCPFFFLQNTLGSILNGLDKQLITFRNNIIGLTIRIAFIYLLIPVYGLKGYLWGLLASFVVVALLNVVHLIRFTSIDFEVGSWLVKPIFVCVASISIIDISKRWILLPFDTMVNTLVYMMIYVVITVPLLILTGTIAINEVKFFLPGKVKTLVSSSYIKKR